MKRIKKGTMVRLNIGEGPVRLWGRTGLVVGVSRLGRGFKYEVSFAPRRATPITLTTRQFTCLSSQTG